MGIQVRKFLSLPPFWKIVVKKLNKMLSQGLQNMKSKSVKNVTDSQDYQWSLLIVKLTTNVHNLTANIHNVTTHVFTGTFEQKFRIYPQHIFCGSVFADIFP